MYAVVYARYPGFPEARYDAVWWQVEAMNYYLLEKAMSFISGDSSKESYWQEVERITRNFCMLN